jgi:hypothetical protein
MCRSFCNNLGHILLGISLGVVLLDNMADLCLVFLRKVHMVFQSGCTSLHCQQQLMRVPFFLQHHQHLFLMVFLVIAILRGVRWNSVIFICISFMARNGEHVITCCLAIWISFIEKFLFSSVAQYFLGSLIWGEFSFLSSMYMLVISPLSDV